MKALLKFLLILVALAGVLLFVLRLFFFDIAQTNSYSMVPTLIAGDTIAVKRDAKLELGDLALCRSPEDGITLVVGRVVGLPGMTVEIRDDALFINGDPVPTKDRASLTYVNRVSEEDVEVELEAVRETIRRLDHWVAFGEYAKDKNMRPHEVEDGYFLLGDNRNHARDSRYFGEVPTENCIGQPVLILWPAEDNGDLKKWDRLLNVLL